MRRTLPILLLILIFSPISVFSFAEVERMPYFVKSQGGKTIYWNESYRILAGDLELQLVTGTARVSDQFGDRMLEWDPEIISIKVEDEEVMRRKTLEFISDDPLLNMPFLGIGGVVSPTNEIMGLTPSGAPASNLEWGEKGEEGVVSWSTSYQYKAGDRISWLNRSFLLNASLKIDCEFTVVDAYQAMEQKVMVTNGDESQSLPFPLETAFCLGSSFEEKALSLPNMTLEPDRYFTYPATDLPVQWYDPASDSYSLPGSMWSEDDLPGLLYTEFDLQNRDWFGAVTETQISYQMQGGAGVRVLSSQGFEDFRPYSMFISGEDDHMVFGFKPYSQAGSYDDFTPMTVDPGEQASLELLWFFPESEGETMGLSDLEEFANQSISVSQFVQSEKDAEELFKEANSLAADGQMVQAVDKATSAFLTYQNLGKISDTMLEESRNINTTITTWRNSASDPEPHPEKGDRSAMFITLGIFLVLLISISFWVYVIKPRRAQGND